MRCLGEDGGGDLGVAVKVPRHDAAQHAALADQGAPGVAAEQTAIAGFSQPFSKWFLLQHDCKWHLFPHCVPVAGRVAVPPGADLVARRHERHPVVLDMDIIHITRHCGFLHLELLIFLRYKRIIHTTLKFLLAK